MFYCGSYSNLVVGTSNLGYYKSKRVEFVNLKYTKCEISENKKKTIYIYIYVYIYMRRVSIYKGNFYPKWRNQWILQI